MDAISTLTTLDFDMTTTAKHIELQTKLLKAVDTYCFGHWLGINFSGGILFFLFLPQKITQKMSELISIKEIAKLFAKEVNNDVYEYNLSLALPPSMQSRSLIKNLLAATVGLITYTVCQIFYRKSTYNCICVCVYL